MLQNEARVQIVGTCTKDAELLHNNKGEVVAYGKDNARRVLVFSLAKNNRRQDANGQWVDGTPDFFDVNVSINARLNAENYPKKGEQVIVNGKLKQDVYEKDGQKHSRLRIYGDEYGVFKAFVKADAPAPAPVPVQDDVDITAFDNDLPF